MVASPRLPSLGDLRAALGRARETAAGESETEQLRRRLDEIRAATSSRVDRAAACCVVAARAVRRVLGVDLHEEQLLASLALATGWSVQMRTGEGKTFAAIGPALAWVLERGHVHVVTANPYLAARDAGWSGAVLQALGCSVGVTLPGRPRSVTRAAYQADVVFGAAHDFGFDFLRDQLHLQGEERAQRGRVVALIDEADAVLLDAARTPLVLSARAASAGEDIRRADAAVRLLDPATHVDLDQPTSHVGLTDAGAAACERSLGVANIYASGDVDWPDLIRQALRAHLLLERDRDYVVDEAIGVVDEVTGRVVADRRWSEGLHQAVEAKEGLAITHDRRPLGQTTVAGYFAGYQVAVGMSGTFDGAEAELAAVQRMPIVTISTHRPTIRLDKPDAVFATRQAKLEAIVDDIVRRHHRRQPVLVGTVSIAQARRVSELLQARGVRPRVLAATNDHEEAAIIAEAGAPGAITVATQMAGRGVDIVLGGADGRQADRDEAVAAGGLMVWGVEHHRARRLDLQLRGRSGRQGDPGETQFAACPDDEVFVSEDHSYGDSRAAQAALEQLDAATRADGMFFDTPIDEVHLQLAEWRAELARLADPTALLEAAVRVAAADPPAPLAVPRRGRPGRRGRLAQSDHIEALLRGRQAPLSGAWPALSRDLLLHLTVIAWPDALQRLDAGRRQGHLAHLFGNNPLQWPHVVAREYDSFKTDVLIQWVAQLSLAHLVTNDFETPTADVPAQPSALDDSDMTSPYTYQWEGQHSFNAFVRRHWGVRLPVPPVVVELDSIGDSPRSAFRFAIDLDDPTNSYIVVKHPG